MIYSLSGTLVARKPSCVIVEVNGIGFRVAVSEKTAAKLKRIGMRINVFCHVSVRQHDIEICGFLREREFELFELLISVTGIGPRTALKLIDVFTINRLSAAVRSGRTDLFTGASRIGTKTATRIIMELQGKLGKEKDAGRVLPTRAIGVEVQEALRNLGYSSREIRAVIPRIPHGAKTLQAQLKAALFTLGKK